MKFSILLDILIELLSKRRVTASYLAEKHSLSQRTVYRYIAILAETVPAQIKRGRGGGICLSDSYKLPLGFLTAEEYDAAIEALSEAYTRSPEDRFLEAKRKLSAQEKADLRELSLFGEAGDILVDENALDLPLSAAEKLRLVGACIRSLNILEIEYVENGEKTTRKIEPHTLYGKCPPPLPDDDIAATLYLTAMETLERLGYRQYEISNLARPGQESRHNLKYWNGQPYLGLGPAASSFLQGRRFSYPRDLTGFLAGSQPVEETDTDMPAGSAEEYALLRLRLTEGLQETAFCARFGKPLPAAWRQRAAALPAHLVQVDEQGIRFTREGFLLSNALLTHILHK